MEANEKNDEKIFSKIETYCDKCLGSYNPDLGDIDKVFNKFMIHQHHNENYYF